MESDYPLFMRLLNERVIAMFPHNPSIKPIDFSQDTVEDQGIPFNVKLLKLLALKPTSTKETFSPLITKDTKPSFNPFEPPFEHGAYIDEITDTHRMIFNKFSVCERHVIVITKEFQKQIDPLDIDDFKASVIAMVSLNAFMFFNSGFNSGASIMHKHMQVIPYNSFDPSFDAKTKFVPVEQVAIEYIKSHKVASRMFTLPQFSKFKHIFYRIDEDFFDKV